MDKECTRLFAKAWENHRGCVMGAIVGALIAVSILLFGFWNMLFFWVCVAAGIWLGKQIDDADDGWLQNLRESGLRGLDTLVRGRGGKV